jgi:hypothetical protein
MLDYKEFDIDPKESNMAGTFVEIHDKINDGSYHNPDVCFNSVLKNHLYDILKTEFKDISNIKFNFGIYGNIMLIRLDINKDEKCLQYTYKIQPLCDYISYLFRIFDDPPCPIYTKCVVLPMGYNIDCDSSVLRIYIINSV